jgi:SdrD B-like protein
MREKLIAVWLFWAAMAAHQVEAITVGSFGPKGEGGSKNGQSFSIGSGGTVFELDGFLTVQGLDLNGSQLGTAAQLSRDSLPDGLAYTFSSALSPNNTDIVLTYSFSNATTSAFSDVQFFVLLDTEIDEAINTFFNEYGTVLGKAGQGAGDSTPSQWQIDEPGFQTGTLFRNLFLGTLDNSNSIPRSALNDVAMSLGFSLGTLNPGNATTVRVLISEAGNTLGSLALIQHDNDTNSTTVVTLSGLVGSLSGTVFHDFNTNGLPDVGEGLSGVVLSALSNSVSVAQVTTDANGKYTFSSLPPGNYSVQVDPTTLPAGLTLTASQNGATTDPWPVTLPAAVPVLNWAYVGGSAQFTDVSALVQLGLKWQLNRAHGSLMGTVSITNSPSSGATLGDPWQLGMHAATNFFYPTNFGVAVGTLPDGVAEVDLSAAVNGQAAGGNLAPGQWVVLTNAVEIYSADRSVPPGSLFELWATRQ